MVAMPAYKRHGGYLSPPNTYNPVQRRDHAHYLLDAAAHSLGTVIYLARASYDLDPNHPLRIGDFRQGHATMVARSSGLEVVLSGVDPGTYPELIAAAYQAIDKHIPRPIVAVETDIYPVSQIMGYAFRRIRDGIWRDDLDGYTKGVNGTNRVDLYNGLVSRHRVSPAWIWETRLEWPCLYCGKPVLSGAYGAYLERYVRIHIDPDNLSNQFNQYDAYLCESCGGDSTNPLIGHLRAGRELAA